MSEPVGSSDSPKAKRAKGDSSPDEDEIRRTFFLKYNEPILKQDTVIESDTDQYKIIKEIGKGIFGNVFEGTALLAGRTVAVKKIREQYGKQEAEEEYEAAQILKGCNLFVDLLDFCEHNGYPVLVFEFFSQNLHQFITKRGDLPLRMIRSLTRQLMMALHKLKECRIIHADLKPENIMISDTESIPHLKIAEFGRSKMPIGYTEELVQLQTLYYRAPEVILMTTYSEKVNMWSAGCIVAEMVLERPIYPGFSEYDQLMLIIECQNMLPYSLLSNGSKTSLFFKVTADGEYELKKAEEYSASGGHIKGSMCCLKFKSLAEIAIYVVEASKDEKMKFVSFLELILHLDPDLRFSPEEAIKHDFLTQDDSSL